MVAGASRSAAVSRTSSSSSTDYVTNAFNAVEQRRTRRRITADQLVQLEELYYRSSHPTRDQRDALAKRVQMETKSVTIWFQNKRQTDRKVALHNATNSRNVSGPQSSSDKPDITLTTPTSPAHTSQPSVSQEETPRDPSEKITRKQPITRLNPLKRVHSISSGTTSVASTSSTTSAFRARPSLDRVASRSEIRFTDQAPLRKSSSAMPVRTKDSTENDNLVPGISDGGGGELPGKCHLTRSDDYLSAPPASPPPSKYPPLWTTMLSSPITPSSPPPAELVAYTRGRKIRTLDWACATDRLAKGVPSADDFARFSMMMPSPSPAASFSEKDRDAPEGEREYEEATIMTEDEAEIVTPHGSQDVSMPWAGDISDAKSVARTFDTTGAVHAIGLLGRSDKAKVLVMHEGGWQEDEVYAALALCGLRG